MGRFLRENWIWIAVPIAILVLVCLVIAWLTTGDSPAPMQYPF